MDRGKWHFVPTTVALFEKQSSVPIVSKLRKSQANRLEHLEAVEQHLIRYGHLDNMQNTGHCKNSKVTTAIRDHLIPIWVISMPDKATHQAWFSGW